MGIEYINLSHKKYIHISKYNTRETTKYKLKIHSLKRERYDVPHYSTLHGPHQFNELSQSYTLSFGY